MSTWREMVVATIREGECKEQVLERLQPYGPKLEMGIGSGGSSQENYRLDDWWLVQCVHRDAGNTLLKRGLASLLRWVWGEPAPHFTGVWVAYFPNEQTSHRIGYQEGRHFGELASFRSDGSKCFVGHYGPMGAEFEETGS